MISARLRDQVQASATAGVPLDEIERHLIDSAALREDEKAAPWLLAWSAISVGRRGVEPGAARLDGGDRGAAPPPPR